MYIDNNIAFCNMCVTTLNDSHVSWGWSRQQNHI